MEETSIETTEEATSTSLDELKGAFVDSLKRNNKKIRDDRAVAISEDAQIIFKRKIEDMELRVKKLVRERENMLDLSPTNADSLVLATDFDANAFADKDIDIALQIRNIKIKLDLAKLRYNVLFQ